MRILLDESLPRKLGFLLVGHHVRTVQQVGFSGLANGKLLAAAASGCDSSQRLQQQTGKLFATGVRVVGNA